MPNDFDWSDLRASWNDASKKEKPERVAWMTPEMWSMNTMLSDLTKNYEWRRGHCEHPDMGETVIGWNPGDTPFRCQREADYRQWTVFVDGDAWPCSAPLVWRKEAKP